MDLATFSHEARRGWSVPRFPDLDSTTTLVLVFGPTDLEAHEGALTELLRAYPSSVVAGCSSAGEIEGGRVREGSLAVAVVRFASVRVRAISVPVGGEVSSGAAGERLGRGLVAPGLRAVLLLSDGLVVNGTALVAAVATAVPSNVVVTGGLAGDGTRFARTWVLREGAPVSGHVVGIGLYGAALGVSHGSEGGWTPFGASRCVTRAKGNVLYELDGEPALALYKRYLGDRAAGLPATALLFPLCIPNRNGRGDAFVVRTILSVDEADQSMTFAGDVPEGAMVQLMRASVDGLVDGASQAALAAAVPCSSPSLWIAVSCVGRHLVLGDRVGDEVSAVLEALDEESALVGLYSYGEIAPPIPGYGPLLHNQTMTVTRIWEA